jgi:pimeloyl-ACP methyl ester carboxylesterase
MLSRTTKSFDGVRIVYSVSGSAESTLIFVHGGMSDRSFWDKQHAYFAERFRVIALDLAGHGESGQNREVWGIPEFGRDIVAVMDAEHVSRAVLIGNSLGGPAAIEATVLTGKRVLAVIGVDTFHDMGRTMDADQILETAEEWRRDFRGSMDKMLGLLLHPDLEPALYADIRDRMSRMPIDSVCAMFRGFGGYDTAKSARDLTVPVRGINGDRFPTDVQVIRRTLKDFDAMVLPHTGHYPMLECPDEFNRQLEKTLRGLAIY